MVPPRLPIPQEPCQVVPPPSRYAATTVGVHDKKMERDQDGVEMDEEGDCGPYPLDELKDHDSRKAKEQDNDEVAATCAAERRSQLCSLVPVALCVQRQVCAPPSSSVASGSSALPSSVSVQRRPSVPVPRPTLSSLDVMLSQSIPLHPTLSGSNNSVSKEYDLFMEEVKELL